MRFNFFVPTAHSTLTVRARLQIPSGQVFRHDMSIRCQRNRCGHVQPRPAVCSAVLPVPVPSSDTYPSSWSQLYAHFSGSGGSVLSPSSSSHFISDGCRYSNKFTPGLGAEHSPCEHVILHECIRHRLGLRAAVGRDIRSLWARKHREPPS
jgi:hypothetical protein